MIAKMKSLIGRSKKWIIVAMIVKGLLAAGVMVFAQDAPHGNGVVKIKTSAVCGMCKERIEKGLAFEKGIKDVSLDLKSKIVTVTYKPRKTSIDKIKKAITSLGYDADEMEADPKAYGKLPACCKKDALPHD